MQFESLENFLKKFKQILIIFVLWKPAFRDFPSVGGVPDSRECY